VRIPGVRIVILGTLLLGAGAAGCGRPEETATAGPEARRPPRGDFDATLVDSLSGAPGILDRSSGTYSLSIPRNDLVVTVDGIRLTPRMGLSGWIVFDPLPGGAVLTAQLPLLEDEVNPVISAALLHGLRVTGLHAHFDREQPRVRFLHLAGIGETDSLARAAGAVLQTLRDVTGQPAVTLPPIDPTGSTLDPGLVDSVLRSRGEIRQGVYRIVFPRSTRLDEYELGSPSGVATEITFVGGNDRAVTGGHFALLEGELQPVLRALRAGDIRIVSIEDPLVGEEPRLVFVHFWGRGRVVDLGEALREALSVVQAPRP
jgi:hypothetical protein